MKAGRHEARAEFSAPSSTLSSVRGDDTMWITPFVRAILCLCRARDSSISLHAKVKQ